MSILLLAALPASAEPLDADPLAIAQGAIQQAQDATGLPLEDIAGYPDHVVYFASWYAGNVRDAALGLVPGELPRPEPGSVPSLLIYAEDYVNNHTSLASVDRLVDALFPTGIYAQWMTDRFQGVTGLELTSIGPNAINDVYGEQPPEQGMVPFTVITAVAAAEQSVFDDGGAVQETARGAIAGSFGQPTADLVFTIVGTGAEPIQVKVSCFGQGSVSDWASCATAQSPP